jgi:NADPH:quinone reductase-like Zn-dependent oxidoreductase
MAVGTVASKPRALSHDDAAAIPVAGVTALRMADAASLAPGQVAVVIGASGGVGSYLVQLAVDRGARVVGVASGPNLDYIRSLGASQVIDYTAGPIADAVAALFPDGIDFVGDTQRDKDLLASVAALVRSGGHVTSATGTTDIEGLSARGIGGTNVSGNVETTALETLASLVAEGRIRSPETRTMPLDDATAALEQVGTGHTRGKLLVTP